MTTTEEYLSEQSSQLVTEKYLSEQSSKLVTAIQDEMATIEHQGNVHQTEVGNILLDAVTRHLSAELINKAHGLSSEWVDKKRLSILAEPLGHFMISDEALGQKCVINQVNTHLLQVLIPIHGDLHAFQEQLNKPDFSQHIQHSVFQYISKATGIEKDDFVALKISPFLSNYFGPLYFNADTRFHFSIDILCERLNHEQFSEHMKWEHPPQGEFNSAFLPVVLAIRASEENHQSIINFSLNSKPDHELQQVWDSCHEPSAEYHLSTPLNSSNAVEDYARMFFLKWSMGIALNKQGKSPKVSAQEALNYDSHSLSEITHLNWQYTNNNHPLLGVESVINVEIRTPDQEVHSIYLPEKVQYMLGNKRLTDLILQYFKISSKSPFYQSQEDPLSFRIPEVVLQDHHSPITFRNFAKIFSSRTLENPNYE